MIRTEVSPKHRGEYLSSVDIDHSKRRRYAKLPYHGETTQEIGMICRRKEKNHSSDEINFNISFLRKKKHFSEFPSYLQALQA